LAHWTPHHADAAARRGGALDGRPPDRGLRRRGRRPRAQTRTRPPRAAASVLAAIVTPPENSRSVTGPGPRTRRRRAPAGRSLEQLTTLTNLSSPWCN